MTRRDHIICAGRVYVDLIFDGLPRLPSLGTEVYAQGLGLFPGGGAFITAAHLRALGRDVALAGYLPTAPFGAALSQAMETADIDLGLCAAAPPGSDPQVTVALLQAADRAFVTRRSGPPVPKLTSAAVRGARHLHIGELATLAEAPWLIDAARQAGLTLSLDCSWDEGLGPDVAALIAQVDVFLPNAAEVAHLTGQGLCPPFAPVTVVKQGAQGATAYVGSERVHVAARKGPVVDTTGAGDAFNAGFLDRWLSGAPIAACLDAGHGCAARAISYHGGFQPQLPASALKESTA